MPTNRRFLSFVVGLCYMAIEEKTNYAGLALCLAPQSAAQIHTNVFYLYMQRDKKTEKSRNDK